MPELTDEAIAQQIRDAIAAKDKGTRATLNAGFILLKAKADFERDPIAFDAAMNQGGQLEKFRSQMDEASKAEIAGATAALAAAIALVQKAQSTSKVVFEAWLTQHNIPTEAARRLIRERDENHAILCEHQSNASQN
jgi:hypothetical protein